MRLSFEKAVVEFMHSKMRLSFLKYIGLILDKMNKIDKIKSRT